ncbi:MAG: BatA domain-containing protein [Deltaproteobacteria bacterium]|nr:BatA domain-containing protein [Deltaproteobacteria bacterium]MCX7952285.1 BatA domain-containing protein [Deltaproteobacteria bacterium]
MITFLAPQYFFVALSAAIILYVIYKHLKPTRSFLFSATMFIPTVEKTFRYTFPLRAFFDFLPIFFLTLALAQPNKKTVQYTVLFDNSLSTGFIAEPGSDKTILDLLKESAINFLRQLNVGMIFVINACTLESKTFGSNVEAEKHISSLKVDSCKDNLDNLYTQSKGKLVVFSDKSLTCVNCVVKTIRTGNLSNITISSVEFGKNLIKVSVRCNFPMRDTIEIHGSDGKVVSHQIFCKDKVTVEIETETKPELIKLVNGGYNKFDDIRLLKEKIFYDHNSFDFLLKGFEFSNQAELKVKNLIYPGQLEQNTIYYIKNNDHRKIEAKIIDVELASFLERPILQVVGAHHTHISLPVNLMFSKIGEANGSDMLFSPSLNSIIIPFDLPESVNVDPVNKVFFLNLLDYLRQKKQKFYHEESFPPSVSTTLINYETEIQETFPFWKNFVIAALIAALIFVLLTVKE